MREYLRNQMEVAHAWANQTQSKGRAASMFFEGASIFSYGHHFEIARILEKTGKRPLRPRVVLFTSRDYSTTTAKHKSYVRRAISRDYDVFYVPRVEDTADAHAENARYMIEQLKLYKEKALRGLSLSVAYTQQAETWHAQLTRYMENFSRSMLASARKDARAALRRAIWTKEEKAKLEKRAARQSERQAAADKARAARDAGRIEKAMEHLEAWRAGAPFGEYGLLHLLPVALRLSAGGYDVETSHGARVPLNDARRFWLALKKNEAQSGDNIGAFELREVAADHVRIGCHEITRAEMDAFACAQGWQA